MKIASRRGQLPLLAMTLAVSTLGCPRDVLAADTELSPDPAQSPPALEEITVTARKRPENIQVAPISITAFSSASLEQRQITNVADIGKFTPNMSLESATNLGGSSSTIAMFIRGVGQTDFNLTIDPGVGLYLDGVYISRSVGALLDTADLQQVEVLRGPQGTLFGKNTIGGAVVLTSAQPGDTFSITSDITTGRFNRADARAAVNIPINDVVQMRASASIQTRDGYVTQLATGDKMGNRNSISGRLLTAIKALPNLTVTLSADGTRNHEQDVPNTLLSVNPSVAPPGPGASPTFAQFYNWALAAPNCGAPFEPAAPSNPACYTSRWITGDRYTTWSTPANHSNLDLWGLSATVDWGLADHMTLKSVSAYRHLVSSFDLDLDGSPLPVGNSANQYRQRQLSQEFQLKGTAINERLQWLLGLYYLAEQGTDRNLLDFSVANFQSGGSVHNDSRAAFSQLTYKATGTLSVTVGARYTDEKKRFLPEQIIQLDRTGGSLLMLSRCFIRAAPIVPPDPSCVADPVLNPDGNRILPLAPVTTQARELTPSLSIDNQFTQNLLGYVSFSKGFKSGGFTQRVFPPEPATPSFGPEHVRSYELGVKSEWLERRLRANGAAFYADYSDLQIIVNEGIAPKVRNAGDARIKGVELELDAAVTEWLHLSGGLGFTDAAYVSVLPIAFPVTRSSELPNAPKWTATAGVGADVWKGAAGVLSLRADGSYKGAHFKDAVNSPDLRQQGYALLNLSATFADSRDRWTVSAGATNVTNTKYLISGYQDLSQLGAVTGVYARPAEWFARIKYKY